MSRNIAATENTYLNDLLVLLPSMYLNFAEKIVQSDKNTLHLRQ